MNNVLHRLLSIDYNQWEKDMAYLKNENKSIVVPKENTPSTLHDFNCRLSDLYMEAEYLLGESRANKDAIDRIIETVLKDLYKGTTSDARKAAGYQFAQSYPIPDSLKPYYETDTINLFDIEDSLNRFNRICQSTINSLNHKASAKITNNSILNIEKLLQPSS